MSTTEKPILNKEVFENITNGDSELKNQLINIFISSTKEQIAEIKEVAKSSNSNQYQWYSVSFGRYCRYQRAYNRCNRTNWCREKSGENECFRYCIVSL